MSTSRKGEDEGDLRRGPWTIEEDTLLIHYIHLHGEGHWNLLAKRSGLRRTGKSCRLRWLNYLKPDIKRGNLSPQEQIMILQLHCKLGNRWSKIAQHLPGRTDNEIKNYWRTRVQKQARHLKIDTNSKTFEDIIQLFWLPTLFQKIEKENLSSSSSMVSPPPNHASQHATTLMAPPRPQPPHQVDEQGKNPGIDNSFSESNAYTASLVDDGDCSIFSKGCYYDDDICYDVGKFNHENMSSVNNFETPIGDCQMAENDWTDNDFGNGMWSLDELWQFGNLRESET